MLSNTDVDFSKAENLTLMDLLLDEKDLRQNENVFHACSYGIIK